MNKVSIRKVIYCCWSHRFIVRYSTGTLRTFKYSYTPNTVFDFIETHDFKHVLHNDEPRFIYKEVIA